MNRIIYLITISLSLIISCNNNPVETEQLQPPSFDELFYKNYRGISTEIVMSSTYRSFCNNEKSFFEIKNDSTFNLRFCGKILETNDSIDYRTSGKIEILNKSYVPQSGWNYAYWNVNTKITIGHNISYINCHLYIPFSGDDVNLYFADKSLLIFVNGKEYFNLANLWKNYQKWQGC